jgi:hypothetical protein
MSAGPLPPDLISEIRSALLSRPSILASEIGVVVQDVGKRYELSVLLRDLGGAQAFVETHLADLFIKDPSPDSFGPRLRFVARAALPPVPSISTDREVGSNSPETSLNRDGDGRWCSADGHDRSFWDRFNNPLRSARFALTGDGALYWTESAAPLPDGARPIEAMSAEDYRQMAQQFADGTDDAIARQRMQQVLSESPVRSFSTDWFRLVGLLGLRAVWESTRIARVLDTFRERLVAAGASPATADLYAAELSKSKNALKRKPAPSATVRSEVAEERDGTLNLRHLLVELARTLSDDEIRQLRIPLGKVVDLLTTRPHPRKPR